MVSVSSGDVVPVAGPLTCTESLASFASHPGRLPSANQGSLRNGLKSECRPRLTTVTFFNCARFVFTADF